MTATVALNSLQYGTGGINIDSSRIHTTEQMSFSKAAPFTSSEGEQGRTWNPTSTPGMDREQHSGGRWPANLVLQHLTGCCQTGVKTVKGTGHYPSSRPKGSDLAGATGHSGQDGLPETHLTRERVANWVCVEGCPVNALDSQSGILASGRVLSHYRRNSGRQPSKGGYEGGLVTDIPLTGHDGSGGASRFFKHVTQTMVTPSKETHS